MSDAIVVQPVEVPTAAGEVNNEHHEEVPAPVTPSRKRAPAAAKVDENGNALPKTPRKIATPKAKVDADGNPTPKTPRKPATPKQPKVDENGKPITKTPKKSATKAKATVKTEDSQDEGSRGDSGIAVDNADGADTDGVAPPATPASKRRASNTGAAETPSKRAKSTPVKGNAIPSNKADLSEADRMLMDWRESGKSWGDIRSEYARLTGKPVGNSTLPNRYIRLKASLVELKDGDMELVLYAKDIIAQEQVVELETFKKKQENEAWGRIATKIPGFGADTYSGDAIAKAYTKEKLASFPHKQTDRYTALMLNGPNASQDSEQGGSQDGAEVKDEVEVDFDENGSPVYTDHSDEQTPGTVIRKKVISGAPVNGISLAEISESASGKSTSQEDDGAVFS